MATTLIYGGSGGIGKPLLNAYINKANTHLVGRDAENWQPLPKR